MNLLTVKPTQAFEHKHLLSLMDYTPDDVLAVLACGARLKAMQKAGQAHRVLAGKTIGMYFSKPSMRTRVSFEVGIHQLGAQPVMLSAESIGIGVRETVPDVAGVLSRYLDGLMIRTFAQQEVEQLAANGNWSVINGLTDDFHPCQAFADLLTLWENFGEYKGVKLSYVGDGNNVAHSLLLACTAVGADIAIAAPQGYQPNPAVVERAMQNAQQTGSTVTLCQDPYQAVQGAHAVYTDVWTSMGQEAEKQTRMAAFEGYRVTAKMMAAARPDAIFLHCLPAHRGDEVDADVIDGPQSRVYDQAENRLHMQKGVMAMLLSGKPDLLSTL